MEKTAPGKRDARLDLIRVLAAFLVVSLHFFLNIGYYETPVAGGGMVVLSAIRMAFMVCVPLFLLLTGYLCRSKALTPRYYLGLVRVLLTYGLCALVCVGARLWRGEAVGLKGLVKSLLDFSAAPYGWYVEMYVGLFLLIPFLNALWKGLPGRGQRKALVATLLVLTTLPALANFRVQLLPDWWGSVYPLAYYFLGAYFAEYRPALPWGWGLAGLAASAVLGGALVYLLNAGQVFQWNAMTDWYGPTVALSACLLFLLLLRLPADRAPRWVRGLLAKGSQLSLGVYLLSWCFDTAFYPLLAQRAPAMTDRLPWYFVVVPAVFLCSALCAQGVEWLRQGVIWCINKIFPKAELR